MVPILHQLYTGNYVAFLQCHYDHGNYIVREGAIGDTFYIISSGTVSGIKLSFSFQFDNYSAAQRMRFSVCANYH